MYINPDLNYGIFLFFSTFKTFYNFYIGSLLKYKIILYGPRSNVTFKIIVKTAQNQYGQQQAEPSMVLRATETLVLLGAKLQSIAEKQT